MNFGTYDVNDPKYQDLLIKDAIASMKEKVEKYGTSQDPSEWTNPPEYSNPKEYKGFVMVLVYYKDRYRGLAKEMETGSVDLNTDWYEEKNKAGQEIMRYISLFRKQAKMAHLDKLNEQRNRAKERSKIILN